MARKTKAEAALTREKIIQSARAVFNRRGVSTTSLEEVASEAEVTRGAVYWHFKNKADLFRAVRSQTGRLLQLDQKSHGDALFKLEKGLLAALHRLETDSEARKTFEVMLWHCEFVGEFASVRNELMTSGRDFLREITELYQEAQNEKILSSQLDPETTALETYFFFTGLLKIWLAENRQAQVHQRAAEVIRAHIKNKRRVLKPKS
ncbi:MAG: TetR family transcriptional regulator [Opitutae bacterium]